MKHLKNLKLYAFIMLAILVLSGCSKEDEDDKKRKSLLGVRKLTYENLAKPADVYVAIHDWQPESVKADKPIDYWMTGFASTDLIGEKGETFTFRGGRSCFREKPSVLKEGEQASFETKTLKGTYEIVGESTIRASYTDTETEEKITETYYNVKLEVKRSEVSGDLKGHLSFDFYDPKFETTIHYKLRGN